MRLRTGASQLYRSLLEIDPGGSSPVVVAGWWILATMIGWWICELQYSEIYFSSSRMNSDLWLAFAGIASGLLLGVAQSIALRGLARDSTSWMLWTALGWAAGNILSMALSNILYFRRGYYSDVTVTQLLEEQLVRGGIAGLTIGIVQARLLRGPGLGAVAWVVANLIATAVSQAGLSLFSLEHLAPQIRMAIPELVLDSAGYSWFLSEVEIDALGAIQGFLIGVATAPVLAGIAVLSFKRGRGASSSAR